MSSWNKQVLLGRETKDLNVDINLAKEGRLNRISTQKIQTITCKARMIDINPSEGWWYKACLVCKSTIRSFGTTIWCKICDTVDVKANISYKLQSTFSDDTTTATFVIFGWIAQEMATIPAQSLATMPTNDKYCLPTVFKDLLDKSYIFKGNCGSQSTSNRPLN